MQSRGCGDNARSSHLSFSEYGRVQVYKEDAMKTVFACHVAVQEKKLMGPINTRRWCNKGGSTHLENSYTETNKQGSQY